MNRRKFTAKEKAALIILIALMIAVVGVGAYLIVDNVNNANREATNTSHTTIKVTAPTTETISDKGASEKYSKKSSKKSSEKNSSDANSDSKSKTTSSKSSASNKSTTKSKTTSSKTSSKTKSSGSSSGNKISVVTPAKNSSHKSDEKCVINGTTCYVGDTISVTLNLNCAKTLVNYQGYTTFDTSYLKCTSLKANVGIANNKGDTIYYNASVISGLDFSSTGTIYTAQFKVTKAGSTSIDNNFEILTDMKDNSVKVSSISESLTIYS